MQGRVMPLPSVGVFRQIPARRDTRPRPAC